jgi:hypothetical protein
MTAVTDMRRTSVLIHQSEHCVYFFQVYPNQGPQSATSSSAGTSKTHTLFDRLLLGLSILSLLRPAPAPSIFSLRICSLNLSSFFLCCIIHTCST